MSKYAHSVVTVGDDHINHWNRRERGHINTPRMEAGCLERESRKLCLTGSAKLQTLKGMAIPMIFRKRRNRRSSPHTYRSSFIGMGRNRPLGIPPVQVRTAQKERQACLKSEVGAAPSDPAAEEETDNTNDAQDRTGQNSSPRIDPANAEKAT